MRHPIDPRVFSRCNLAAGNRIFAKTPSETRAIVNVVEIFLLEYLRYDASLAGLLDRFFATQESGRTQTGFYLIPVFITLRKSGEGNVIRLIFKRHPRASFDGH